MDPLKKLEERNKKHLAREKAEKKEFLITYPIALILALVGTLTYGYFWYYLSEADAVFYAIDFRGAAKQVWIITLLFTFGIGSILLVASISLIIWFHLFHKTLRTQANSLKIFITSTSLLLLSFGFAILGKWLSYIIVDNRRDISEYLTFGYNEAPMPFIYIFDLFIVFIALSWLQALHALIKLPFKARRHAQEFYDRSTSDIEIISAHSIADIKIVSQLAHQIWHEHFTDIIGKKQVNYMLDKFQSEKAIKQQIAEGYQYYIINQGKAPLGYTAIVIEENQLMISKLYTLKKIRGKSIGKALLNFIESQAEENEVSELWLTVNKNNRSTINWYKRQGFQIKEAAQFDIGNGFIMDDYIMDKKLNTK